VAVARHAPARAGHAGARRGVRGRAARRRPRRGRRGIVRRAGRRGADAVRRAARGVCGHPDRARHHRPDRVHHVRRRPQRRGAGPRGPRRLRLGQPDLGGLPGDAGDHPADPGNLKMVNVGGGAGLGGDAEQGRAQANALGGSRNNANQGTPRDGLPPTTNMFLWQPVAGAAYPPCVDGDYDMTVMGHEYTHAITNRMIAGPDTGITSFQGGSMGEAWSDLTAAEYLAEYGYRAPGDTPFVTGAYVTGNT